MSTGVFFSYDTPHFITEDVTPTVVDPDGTTASYAASLRARWRDPRSRLT